ncbi:GPP34 family phosphoprotein [Asanoa sp. NPDC050611]|uniref:GOLPH3/VPS74 family protein n=1 Tax=Asanoa sp. NPDC050611 TaxID=3157098 RepID=UPI0033EDA7B9
MSVNLAEDLLLLGYEDDGTPTADSGTLDYGLAGAVLVELAADGRIRLAGGRVHVDETTGATAQTGDPVLDHGLRRISGYGRPATPSELLDAVRSGLRDLVLDGLVARGVLRREPHRFLLIPLPRFPSANGGQPAAETATRARLEALGRGEPTDARTHTLATLAVAAGLTASAFPGVARATVERRLAELPEPWPVAAVREILDEVQLSIIAITTMFLTGS